MEAQDNIRKRVCKACDRCRLKKSKVCSRHLTTMTTLLTVRFSVMEQALAVGVKPIMLSACLERGRSRKTKSIPKGMLLVLRSSLLDLTFADMSRCLNNNKPNL